MKYLIIGILIMALVGVAGAVTVSCNDVEVRTYQETAVTLDAAAAGLSGYNMTIAVADPTKAEITSVTFPSWAVINTCGSTPASSVTCTAADLNSQVQAGATNTNLCTVRLRSIASGATTCGITVNSMDNDVGGAIAPTIDNGTITSKTSARTMAANTITPISTQAYNDIWNSFGGNESPDNETDALINWTEFLGADLSVYTLLIGYLAFVIIFAIPFVLMWLMQSDMVPAGIAGIIIGGFMLLWLPAEYSLLAGVFVVLAIVAVVYSLLKERM